MKKVFSHIKRIFKYYWYVIIIISAVSLIWGLGLLVVMTAISLLLLDDPIEPIDEEEILKNFTEEQKEILLSEELDMYVSDDDYLTLFAKYESYCCPRRTDRNTIWTGSMVTDEAYIYCYEIKGNAHVYTKLQKESILSQINKYSVNVRRLVKSNRNLIFRYTYCQTGETVEVVFDANELRG